MEQRAEIWAKITESYRENQLSVDRRFGWVRFDLEFWRFGKRGAKLNQIKFWFGWKVTNFDSVWNQIGTAESFCPVLGVWYISFNFGRFR